MTSVADGGAVPVEPGSAVRLCLLDGPGTLDLSEMDLTLSGEDVVVRLPDGQAITLLGFAESLAEQALVQGMTGDHVEPGPGDYAGDYGGAYLPAADPSQPASGPTAGMVEGWDQPLMPEPGAIFGQKVTIDYLGQDGFAVGDGPDLSRVELYFDQSGDVSVDALFTALEVELGLKDRSEDSGARITAVTVADDPLALSDLVGAPGDVAPAEAITFGALPAHAELLGFLGIEEEAVPVNDNSIINA